jgi:DinB family protein
MQPALALPAWPSRLVVQLDAADERTRALLAEISPERLNWHPRPGAWSVGQCLEHLCITNDLYLSSMSASLTGKPAGMVREIELGWFARWFIASFVEPSSNTKKARAPKKIVPGSRVDLSILDRFLRSNENAREMIRSASGYDVNRIRFKNPFLPLVRFTVGTGLEAMCRHECRHLLQAERVAKSPGFSPATSS